MIDLYLFFKLVHFISFISWMVGMFYLPRLLVYHSGSAIGSDKYKTFCVMEKRLLKIIMNPAMVLTWFIGITLILYNNIDNIPIWLHIKVFLVFIMSGLHGFFAVCQKNFANNINKHSARFYKVINEIPTVLLVAILFLVIFKPFV